MSKMGEVCFMVGCVANLDAVHVICDMVGLEGAGTQSAGQGEVKILQMHLVWSAAVQLHELMRPLQTYIPKT